MNPDPNRNIRDELLEACREVYRADKLWKMHRERVNNGMSVGWIDIEGNRLAMNVMGAEGVVSRLITEFYIWESNQK